MECFVNYAADYQVRFSLDRSRLAEEIVALLCRKGLDLMEGNPLALRGEGGELMGIQMLQKLLDRQDYRLCTEVARELLADEGLSVQDKAEVQHALCRSLIRLGEGQEAVGAGEIAVFLARQNADWDLLGRAIVDSGCAYFMAGCYDKAVARLAEFGEYREHFDQALRFAGQVHYNTGIALHALHRYPEAAEHFARARAHAQQCGDLAEADDCRRNQVWNLMRGGKLADVPALLAEGDRYVADHPNDTRAHFDHLNDRAFYLYLEGQHAEAVPLINEVLETAGGYPEIQAWAALTAHYIAKAEGLWPEALRMGIIANNHAFKAGRLDQSAEIENSVHEIVAAQGEQPVMDLLDQLGVRYRKPGKGSGRRGSA